MLIDPWERDASEEDSASINPRYAPMLDQVRLTRASGPWPLRRKLEVGARDALHANVLTWSALIMHYH